MNAVQREKLDNIFLLITLTGAHEQRELRRENRLTHGIVYKPEAVLYTKICCFTNITTILGYLHTKCDNL